jgi:hypothetical protein
VDAPPPEPQGAPKALAGRKPPRVYAQQSPRKPPPVPQAPRPRTVLGAKGEAPRYMHMRATDVYPVAGQSDTPT